MPTSDGLFVLVTRMNVRSSSRCELCPDTGRCHPLIVPPNITDGRGQSRAEGHLDGYFPVSVTEVFEYLMVNRLPSLATTSPLSLIHI
jgi:hypothetical protein